ncbi:MAG: hypothetical protein KDA81_13550 [Planctomycetaceae bacterium]|nr:hypothetical protein [Planctomycetaceae bacterium]
MSTFRIAAAALFLCLLSSSANAQTSISNTYHVQVRVEMWTSGASGWQTVYSTTDYDDAELMLELYEIALDSGSLSEVLGLSWYYIATDVRLQTEYPEVLTSPVYQSRLRTARSYGGWSYVSPGR